MKQKELHYQDHGKKEILENNIKTNAKIKWIELATLRFSVSKYNSY